jgi:hypothetical protein
LFGRHGARIIAERGKLLFKFAIADQFAQVGLSHDLRNLAQGRENRQNHRST